MNMLTIEQSNILKLLENPTDYIKVLTQYLNDFGKTLNLQEINKLENQGYIATIKKEPITKVRNSDGSTTIFQNPKDVKITLLLTQKGQEYLRNNL